MNPAACAVMLDTVDVAAYDPRTKVLMTGRSGNGGSNKLMQNPLETARPTPSLAPVAATRSWPVSELIVAMMASVLLHIVWFTVFLATAGFRPEPPWVVFAAAPEVVDTIVSEAPASKPASVRTAPPAVTKRELASAPTPRPSRPLSPPSASPATQALVPASPRAQATTPEPATPPAAPQPSPIPPSPSAMQLPEPTPTLPETVALGEPPEETPAALTKSPTVSATPEPELPPPSASARATATAAAPVLPPIPEPQQMPALSPPSSDLVARAPIPAPVPTTAAPPGPEPSEKTAVLPSIGPPADEGLAESAGRISPPAPVAGGSRVDAAPARDIAPLEVPPEAPNPPADRVKRSTSGTDDTTRQGGTAAVRGTSESSRVAAVASTLQPSDSARTPGGGAAERPGTQSSSVVAAASSAGPGIFDPQQKADTPSARTTQAREGVLSPGSARSEPGVAGPQKSRGPGALRIVTPRDGLTLGAEDAPIVIIEADVADADDATLWLVANGYRTPVRVRDGRLRVAMPVLERTTRLWIEAPAAAGEPPRKSNEITVVNTAPGPVSVLAIESPLNSAEHLQVTASWRPFANRFDGVVNGIPLRRFDAGHDVEPSTFFYMRHSGVGVFRFIVRGRADAPSSTVSTRLYHLLNGRFAVRDVRSVRIGVGASGIAARILFPFGVEWNQSEWFTGRAEGSDTITQFRFPEAVGWTERRIDLR